MRSVTATRSLSYFGHKETIEAATREAAEFEAKDRVGDTVPIVAH